MGAKLGGGRLVDQLDIRDAEVIEAEPFDAFTVHPAGVAVYHLGNSGAARKQLKAWSLTS